MDKKSFDYNSFDLAREDCYKKFGSIFDLPIIHDLSKEIGKNYSGGNILDLGAGAKKPLGVFFKSRLKNGKYYSLDNDAGGNFDFNDIKQVPNDLNFSLIVANQLFEHLTIDESLDFFEKISGKVAKDGKVIITIPNIAHPNRYWGDITHKTHWNYNNAYMLFKSAGLDVQRIARYSKRHPKGIIERILANYISKIYRMDWCDSVILIAEKK